LRVYFILTDLGEKKKSLKHHLGERGEKEEGAGLGGGKQSDRLKHAESKEDHWRGRCNGKINQAGGGRRPIRKKNDNRLRAIRGKEK